MYNVIAEDAIYSKQVPILVRLLKCTHILASLRSPAMLATSCLLCWQPVVWLWNGVMGLSLLKPYAIPRCSTNVFQQNFQVLTFCCGVAD